MLLMLACVPAEPPGWDGLEVQLDPFRLDFMDGGITAISVGFEPDYDDAVNHDPWALLDPLRQSQVPFFTFETTTSAEWDGDALLLRLDGGHTAHLSRLDAEDGVHLRIEADGDTLAPFVRVTAPLFDQAYGLGEQFEAVNLAGHARAMQLELDLDLESQNNEAHVPVPFLVTDREYAIGVPSDHPMAWDVGATTPDRVDVIVNDPDGVDVWLFGGDAEAMIAGWTRTVGLPRRPPDWAFAPMLWRNVVDGSGDVREDFAGVRANDLAFGTYWVDNPWQSFYSSMQPDPAMFPDWDALVEEGHDAGFRMMAWNVPYVSDEDPATVRTVDLVVGLNDFGDLVDLTDPDAMTAWQARVSEAKARGIEGWKLDYGEDVQLGVNATRWKTAFANGEDERTMHHRFAEFYHRAYGDPYGREDRFLLGRGGAFGTAAITDCVWPGDLDNDLSHFGDPGVSGGLAVGGLPSAIHAGISLAVSGFPAFASDTGGYRHGRPDAETMIRWTEYAALMPIMQVGGGGSDHDYWRLTGDWGPDVLAAGQRYTQLHTRLFPFFQSLLARAASDGTPPLLPLALSGGGEDEEAYVLGGKILVAPVIERGATTRTIEFPEGRWIDWWTGEPTAGHPTVDAPLGQGPLYLTTGAIVPMLRESVRTLSPAKGVDSWADDPGTLVIRFVPGDNTFQVIDGPAIEGVDEFLNVGDLGTYSDLYVEIWTEATHVRVDGTEFPAARDGAWLRAAVRPGKITWE